MRQIITILLILVSSVSMIAQVNIHYPDNLTGRAKLGDIIGVRVTNFTGVEIDYIYKVVVFDENQEEVIRFKSDVLSQKRGARNYAEEKVEAWKLKRQGVVLENYTGNLKMIAELVHPLDTISIIARVTKEIQLKEGIYVDEQGKPVTDPRLVQLEFGMRYDDKFNLDSLYEKVFFENKNEVACCLPLSLEIMQGEKNIYSIELAALCLPPGKHNLKTVTEKQSVPNLDKYADRDLEKNIIINYRLGKGSGSRTISNIAHANFDKSFSRYTHTASGLSFDFINHATVSSPFSSSSFALVFDQEGKLGRIEYLARPKLNPPNRLGLNHPFNISLKREDFNGSISLTTFSRDNFTEEQLTAFVAYVNNVEVSDINRFQKDELEILAPQQLINPLRNNSDHIFKGFAFLVKDQERVIFYHATYFSPAKEVPLDRRRDSLNLREVLNTISYHGTDLQFAFDEKQQLQNITFGTNKLVTQAKRRAQFEQMREFHYVVNTWAKEPGNQFAGDGIIALELLDSLRVEKGIQGISAIPKYVIITPDETKFLESVTYSWDTAQVNLTYRKPPTTPRFMIHNRTESYDYKEEYKIISSGYTATGVDFSYNTSTNQNSDTKEIRFETSNLEFRMAGRQSIELSRLDGFDADQKWLKAIVGFQNITRSINEVIEVQTLSEQGWTFYFPKKEIKNKEWKPGLLCLIIDSGQHLYRIKLSAFSDFDKELILNKLEIEDQNFEFKFEENGQLKQINLR